MTPSPVSPTSVVGPVNVSGGTGNWTASGQAVASGPPTGSVGGSFSGAHYIEEQELTVSYFRHPNLQLGSLSPQDISLSGTFPLANVFSGSVYTTQLGIKVAATVTVVKSYDTFNTSAFQQPQKFQVLATSADSLGNTYGVVPQGALGPAGQIITSQKFLNRRPWEATDTEVSEQAVGFSMYFHPSATLTGFTPGSNTYANQHDLFGKFWLMDNEIISKVEGISGWAYRTKYITELNYTGRLWGPFISPNDTASYVTALLDQLGTQCSNGFHLFNPDIAVAGATFSHATGELNVSSSNYCPSYQTSRHDYV